MQDSQHPDFPSAQRRCRQEPRNGRPEKADDVAAEETLNHQPRVHDAGVKTRVQSAEKKRPERDAGDPNERRQWEKEPERLGATKGEVGRRALSHADGRYFLNGSTAPDKP